MPHTFLKRWCGAWYSAIGLRGLGVSFWLYVHNERKSQEKQDDRIEDNELCYQRREILQCCGYFGLSAV